MCREEANKWVNTQKEQFIRLGILGEWEKPLPHLKSRLRSRGSS